MARGLSFCVLGALVAACGPVPDAALRSPEPPPAVPAPEPSAAQPVAVERCSSERFRSPIKPSSWGTIRPWFSSRLRHFILESVQLELDGKNFHTEALPSWEELPGQPESLSLAHQHVEPGEHRVDVRVLMRASAAPFGVFGVYFHPYRFKLHTAHIFEMPTHEFIGLSLAVYERAQPTIPIEERPAIECINTHGF